MSSKKPITLRYTSEQGENILLAQETTSFRGEIDVEDSPPALHWIFEGEHVKNVKNSIKLEISY